MKEPNNSTVTLLSPKSPEQAQEKNVQNNFIDPETLFYSHEIFENTNLNTEEILDITFQTIRNMKGPITSKSYEILINNRDFFLRFTPSLFWLTHTSLFHLNDQKSIRHLMNSVSTDWGQFCYPIELQFRTLNQAVRDHLYACIPYFFTQIIQSIYIFITNGNPITAQKNFRISICVYQVRLFTGIVPLDSVIMTRLAHFFKKPPQVQDTAEVVYYILWY